MTLDGIRYIFQIPLAWFRRVEAFVENTYGGNLIDVKRNKDGSAEILVKPDEMKDQVSTLLADTFVTLDTAQTVKETKTWEKSKGTAFQDGAGNTYTLRGYGGTGAGLVLYFGSSTANRVINASDTAVNIGGGTLATITLPIGRACNLQRLVLG